MVILVWKFLHVTLIFTMNHSMFIVSNQMEEFISIQRINKSTNFFH